MTGNVTNMLFSSSIYGCCLCIPIGGRDEKEKKVMRVKPPYAPKRAVLLS